MWKLNYGTGTALVILVFLSIERGQSQEPTQTNNQAGQSLQNGMSNSLGGGGGNGGSGGGTPNWMQMAGQFMTSWTNGFERRRAANNGTAPQGSFVDSLMDGVMNVSADVASRFQNSTRAVSPRFQRMQNRTRNWFDTWRNNWNSFV